MANAQRKCGNSSDGYGEVLDLISAWLRIPISRLRQDDALCFSCPDILNKPHQMKHLDSATDAISLRLSWNSGLKPYAIGTTFVLSRGAVGSRLSLMLPEGRTGRAPSSFRV